MNEPKRCAECEQIVAESQAAFLKLIFTRPKSNVPTRQDFNRYLSELFSSEAELARLQEEWQQSESGTTTSGWNIASPRAIRLCCEMQPANVGTGKNLADETTGDQLHQYRGDGD